MNATHEQCLAAIRDKVEAGRRLSFDDGVIHETTYRETSAYQVVARFVSRPEVYLNEIFERNPNCQEK